LDRAPVWAASCGFEHEGRFVANLPAIDLALLLLLSARAAGKRDRGRASSECDRGENAGLSE
jgi:hypothetical protein